MAKRLLRVSMLGLLTFSLLLSGGPARPDAVHADPNASSVDPLESSLNQASEQFELRSTIAFASSRGNTCAGLINPALRICLINSTEIYLMDPVPDPMQTNARRLTNNGDYDAFPVLTPDGKRIVFDSNRRGTIETPDLSKCRVCTPTDVVDLFVMDLGDYDGVNPIPDDKQRHLTRGGSSTMPPNGKYVAYQASRSGTAGPYKSALSGTTYDSNIFVLNIDDCRKVIELSGVDDCRKIPGEHVKNITNSVGDVDDDPNWSADGTKIVYTRHPEADNVGDNIFAPHAEIWVMTVGPNGTPVPSTLEKPNPKQLTHTDGLTEPAAEERYPFWSSDGTRIAFARRDAVGGLEAWVMNADGTNQVRLTKNNVIDVPYGWSPPNGKPEQVLVARGGMTATQQLYLLTLHLDGTCGNVELGETCTETQLTFPPEPNAPISGANVTPDWGVLRVHSGGPKVTQPSRAPAAAPVPKR